MVNHLNEHLGFVDVDSKCYFANYVIYLFWGFSTENSRNEIELYLIKAKQILN